MTNSSNEKKIVPFNVEPWYAPFSGWLILPLIFTIFMLLGAIIMFFFADPAELSGFDLLIYYADVITIPYILIMYFFWIKRKRIFPILIIIYFIFICAINVTYYINGFQFDPINLAMSIVWVIYFIRSQRVKQTFTH